MLLELITQDGITPTRKGPDEFASPCPACGGQDRFIVHPEKGRFWCRQCDAKGDAIEYLRRFRGMTFHQAAEYAGRPASSSSGQTDLREPQVPRRTTSTPPPEAWTARAEKLASGAHKALVGKPDRLEWLRAKRGLTSETAERFSLGWIERNLYRDRAAWGLPPELRANGKPKPLFIPAGLLIPGPDRLRIRRSEPGEFGRYYMLPGSSNAPLIIGADHPVEQTGAVVVESELDAMLLAQEITGPVLIIATGSTSNGPDQAMVRDLTRRPFVLVALDSDKAGGKAAWGKWMGIIPNATRAPMPAAWGADPTDAHLAGHSLSEWFAMALRLAGHHAATGRTEPATGLDDGVVFRDPLPGHQTPETEPAKVADQGGLVPDFCRENCENLRRSELPGLPVVLGCEQYRGATDWTWSRLDGMRRCPLT